MLQEDRLLFDRFGYIKILYYRNDKGFAFITYVI